MASGGWRAPAEEEEPHTDTVSVTSTLEETPRWTLIFVRETTLTHISLKLVSFLPSFDC